MAATSNWRRVRDQRVNTPERAAAVAREFEIAGAELQLAQLRRYRNMSQETVAEALEVSQPAVSKMERGNEIMVSTIESYVRALGGKLEMRAVFPEETVVIGQGKFGNFTSSPARRSSRTARTGRAGKGGGIAD